MEPNLLIASSIVLAGLIYLASKALAVFGKPLLNLAFGLYTRLSGNFRVGEKVFVHDEKNKAQVNGYIKSFDALTARLVDEGRREYTIPYCLLYDDVTKVHGPAGNYVRNLIDFELMSHQDLDKVKVIMLYEANKLSARMAPGMAPEFKLTAVKPGMMQACIFYWARAEDLLYLGDDLRELILRKFNAEGISLGAISKPKDGYI